MKGSLAIAEVSRGKFFNPANNDESDPDLGKLVEPVEEGGRGRVDFAAAFVGERLLLSVVEGPE